MTTESQRPKEASSTLGRFENSSIVAGVGAENQRLLTQKEASVMLGYSQNSKTEKALTITKSPQKFAKKHFMTILRVSLFYQTKNNAQKTFPNQYFTSFHLSWGNLIGKR